MRLWRTDFERSLLREQLCMETPEYKLNPAYVFPEFSKSYANSSAAWAFEDHCSARNGSAKPSIERILRSAFCVKFFRGIRR